MLLRPFLFTCYVHLLFNMDEFLKTWFWMGREVPEDYKQYNPILRKLNHSPRKLNKLLIYPYGFFFLILSKDMMNRIQDNNDFGEAEEWDMGRAHSPQIKWSVYWYLFIVLGRTLLGLALLHFVLQGQTCLLLQVYLDFLLLHSSPLWWRGHLFLMLVPEGLVGIHRTIQLHLLQH